MKLKMAENSIFAILLRKPWWVSMLVVGVFFVLSGALLPKEYVPFGVMGSLPFLVIAVIAAWRQQGQPSATQVSEVLTQAANMSWRDFSVRVEQGFASQGYTVEKLNGTAADFQLSKGGQVTLVSCKRWKAANHGVDGLKALLAAKEAQEARGCTYIALGLISDSARQFAKAEGIQLMTEPELAKLLIVK
jgi:restriction system protein